MKKRIKAYLKFIDDILANNAPVTTAFDSEDNHQHTAKKDIMPTRKEYEALLSRHKDQIAFFSHERLIHLIVTVLFAILAFASFFYSLLTMEIAGFVLFGALLVLLIPYVGHYYLLENGVQKMYKQYDEIVKRMMQ